MPTSRRRFLQASTASWAAATLAQQSFAQQSFADDRPAVTAPRATDGDSRFEPDWEERLTLTVGPWARRT
ncbi:MAG: twin-arginine translocation signal domain-containing protein [Pirellulaceae bacterium]